MIDRMKVTLDCMFCANKFSTMIWSIFLAMATAQFANSIKNLVQPNAFTYWYIAIASLTLLVTVFGLFIVNEFSSIFEIEKEKYEACDNQQILVERELAYEVVRDWQLFRYSFPSFLLFFVLFCATNIIDLKLSNNSSFKERSIFIKIHASQQKLIEIQQKNLESQQLEYEKLVKSLDDVIDLIQSKGFSNPAVIKPEVNKARTQND